MTRRPLAWLLVLPLALAAGCFSPDEPNCSFRCGPPRGGPQCPDKYECRPDGYCHKQGTTGTCPYTTVSTADMAGVPDGGDMLAAVDMTSDATLSTADMPDGGPADATAPPDATGMPDATVLADATVLPDQTAPADLSSMDLVVTTDMTADIVKPQDMVKLPDLVVPKDMVKLPDLGPPDLAMPDFAMPDLAMPPDLPPVDMKLPPDLASLPDLIGADLAPMTVAVTVGPGGQLRFSPADVTIRKGDTVKWTWASSGHNVVAEDGSFCSPNDKSCDGSNPTSNTNATYSHTFNTAGTFAYYCSVHGAVMFGSVVVK